MSRHIAAKTKITSRDKLMIILKLDYNRRTCKKLLRHSVQSFLIVKTASHPLSKLNTVVGDS